MSPARLGLRCWWVGPAYLSNSEAAVPGVATEPSVSIRAAPGAASSVSQTWHRSNLCFVVFFGFRESSCTRRRQSAPRFFPPGNQCGSRRPLCPCGSHVCVSHTPRSPHAGFIPVHGRAASDEEVGASWAWPRAGGVTGCFGAAPSGVPGFLGGAPLKRRPQRGVVGRAQPGARGAGEGRRLLLPQKLAWKVLYLFLFIHEKWQ